MLRVIAALLATAALVSAAPPLVTIQDVIYKADGTAFNGVLFIEWKSFAASDASYIAGHSATAPVVNGVVRVQLVPTTNAVPAGYYSVRYNSDGRIQFQEYWAVPPSTTPLRVTDVRIPGPAAPGTVTPPPVTTEIQESDVIGLAEDLAIRPVKGVGFAPSRAASIAADGSLEAVVGNASDCVRVDGTAGPCGSDAPGFVDAETPSGALDGVNPTFTVSAAPNPEESLSVFRNGILQKSGVDYTLFGNAIAFSAGSIPQAGDVLTASYRLGGGGAAVAGPEAPQVLCSATGTGTSATALTSLGTCTIPANLLGPGDRVDIRFDYAHTGSGSDFVVELRWGGSVLLSRNVPAAESMLTGRADAAVHGAGAQWSVQSWGAATVFAVSGGNAADVLSAPVTIDLMGRMSASGTDAVTLRAFTVLRYPSR